jgi:RTX calcium-binding nonapeptide repeat (4 copies)
VGGRGSDETVFEPIASTQPGYSPLPASIRVRASGGAANDALAGHAGIDRLEGGEGSDRLAGLTGNDVLDGGPDRDRLLGGRGNDVIDAQWRFAPQFESDPAMRDRVLCGAGRDTAVVDKFDTVQGCERVEVLRPGG